MAIENIIDACIQRLDIRHKAREEALQMSRALIRLCANTIRATHRNEYEQAALLLADATTSAGRLQGVVEQYPDLLAAGYTQDALKEYAEASLVYAFMTGQEAPSAEDLSMEPAAYLNGLCEAASELRRAILDCLRRNEMQRAEHLLSIIDDVYSFLVTIDYPESLTGGLRRSTDALRAVLERTRGDFVAAVRQDQLTTAIAAFEARMHQSDPSYSVGS